MCFYEHLYSPNNSGNATDREQTIAVFTRKKVHTHTIIKSQKFMLT